MSAPLDRVLATESVRRLRLDNGLTLLVRRETAAPVVAIVTWVRAGYFDEPDDVVGIAHVLEHMYFKGTPTRGVGEIAKATKAAGGYLNAGTIYDHTSYYTVLPAASFATGLAIQADAYANSVIDAGELAREIEVIIEEAKRKADNPHAVATETLFELLHDHHRMRRWRIGREPGLRALTRRQVHDFYRTHYQPSNTVLAVVGDVDPSLVEAEVRARYGALRDTPVPRDRGPTEPGGSPALRVRELRGDVAQAEFALGWRTVGTAHADTPALDLAAALLGGGRASRLVRAVRERELAASVSASHYTPTDVGVFMVQGVGDPARTDDALHAAWGELNRLRDAGPTDDEMERVRRLLDAQWMRRLESCEGQANHLAAWEALGDWRLGHAYAASLMTLTGRGVREAMQRHLDPACAALLTYAPRTAPTRGSASAWRDRLAQPAPPPVATASAPPAAPAVHVRAATGEGVVAGVHRFRARNGLPILVRPRPGGIAHVALVLRGGADLEHAQEAGRATIMARASRKATRTRDARRIADEGEFLGAVLSAGVASESARWASSVPGAQLAGALALLADVVVEPTFPEEELAAERAVARSELRQLRDDMMQWPLLLAARAAFGRHPFGRPALGDDEQLDGHDQQAVARWHRRRVLEGDAAVAVVGDVDPADVAALVAARFAGLRPAPVPVRPVATWEPPAPPLVEHRDKAQSAIALAMPGPARGDRRRYDAALLCGIASGLGGRFFEALRERRSLAYTVHLASIARQAGGMITSYIATSPARRDEALDGLDAQWRLLADAGVTAEELDRARAAAIGALAMRQESGASVLGDIADAWVTGTLEELDTHEARLGDVTAEGVRAVAQEALSRPPAVGMVLGATP